MSAATYEDMAAPLMADNVQTKLAEVTSKDTVSKIRLKLQDIQEAYLNIKQDLIITPVVAAKHIGKKFCNVILKCENLQTTGSFKARGVCNIIAGLTKAERSRGCMVAGSRNFIGAMTHFGYKYSVPINVVVPRDCALADRHRYKENFAIIKMHGNDTNEATLHALSYSKEIGSTYVHGEDRLDLLAGYGTLGLELLSQLENVDAMLVPVGSGGLVASIVLAVKSTKPSCLVYGVESEAAPTITRAIQEKKPTLIQPLTTVADSLAAMIAGSNSLNIIKRYLDRMITVDEPMITRAMLSLLEQEKMVVEGGGACSVAALMGNKVPELRGKNVVCLLSGGNINSTRWPAVIEHGLAASGRLVRITSAVPDAPGALARMFTMVTEVGGDVKSFVPERIWLRKEVFTLSVNMIVETTDLSHVRELEKRMMKEYPQTRMINIPHKTQEAKLSKFLDYNIYLKCESLQYTGNCAERGVRNALCESPDDLSHCGIIVASHGALALGAAYHGAAMGIPVTVVLPERSSAVLAQQCAELSAEVVLYGDSVEDAQAYALKVHKENRQKLISSDDPAVMAGLGTVGMEIVTQLPELDAVIVPVNAGSLLAGVLVACKKLKCSCLVYGAECAKVPKMMGALQAGKPVRVPVVSNLADGLNSSMVGSNAFATVRGRLDRMLVVEETFIAQALISVLERERLVADGAGVCALAAVMQGLVPELRGKRAVCVLSGGNIDAGRLARSIQRGLSATGRLIRFAVPVADQHDGLQNLAKAISEENALLRSFVTEQSWVHSEIGTTWANVVVETGNAAHALNFKDHFRELYPTARFAIVDLEDKHALSMRN